MDVHKAVIERRSIHDFQHHKVDEAILEEIFRSASWAPTHRMKEPWELIVYQGEARESYSDLILESYEREGFFAGCSNEKSEKMKAGIRKFLLTIPHHILIYLERDEDDHKFEEDYAAVCAFIQNAQLIAWNHGVGMLWMTSPYLHDPCFIEGVGLDSEKYKLAGVLQAGYPNSIPGPKQRTPIQQKMKILDKPF